MSIHFDTSMLLCLSKSNDKTITSDIDQNLQTEEQWRSSPKDVIIKCKKLDKCIALSLKYNLPFTLH